MKKTFLFLALVAVFSVASATAQITVKSDVKIGSPRQVTATINTPKEIQTISGANLVNVLSRIATAAAAIDEVNASEAVLTEKTCAFPAWNRPADITLNIIDESSTVSVAVDGTAIVDGVRCKKNACGEKGYKKDFKLDGTFQYQLKGLSEKTLVANLNAIGEMAEVYRQRRQQLVQAWAACSVKGDTVYEDKPETLDEVARLKKEKADLEAKLTAKNQQPVDEKGRPCGKAALYGAGAGGAAGAGASAWRAKNNRVKAAGVGGAVGAGIGAGVGFGLCKAGANTGVSTASAAGAGFAAGYAIGEKMKKPDKVPVDPCKANPNATGCKPDPCKTNPKAAGCPQDPCKTTPNAVGCPPVDCTKYPKAKGCVTTQPVRMCNGLPCVNTPGNNNGGPATDEPETPITGSPSINYGPTTTTTPTPVTTSTPTTSTPVRIVYNNPGTGGGETSVVTTPVVAPPPTVTTPVVNNSPTRIVYNQPVVTSPVTTAVNNTTPVVTDLGGSSSVVINYNSNSSIPVSTVAAVVTPITTTTTTSIPPTTTSAPSRSSSGPVRAGSGN